MNDELELEDTPSQTEEELELDTTVEEPEDQGDPLDKIEDVAELRAKAKQYRSSFQRAKGKIPPKVEPKHEEKPKEVVSDGYMKKSDFELANQKKAIHLATKVSETDSEEVKKVKEDILENWDHVRQFYTPRRGKATPEDILEDIKDAHLLSQARRPATKPKADTTDLIATQTMGTGTAKVGEVKKDPPGYRVPVQPTDWYPKKS